METDPAGKLFLLEFLVDGVKCDAGDSQCYCTCLTCVSVQFLDNDSLGVCEDDFHTKSAIRNINNVKNGKSCVFFLTPGKMEEAQNQFDIYVTVSQKLLYGTHTTTTSVGNALISIVNLFRNINSTLVKNSNQSVSKVLQDTFHLVNENSNIAGYIDLYIRMTCLGKSIITQFQINSKDSSVLFKDKDGKALCNYHKNYANPEVNRFQFQEDNAYNQFNSTPRVSEPVKEYCQDFYNMQNSKDSFISDNRATSKKQDTYRNDQYIQGSNLGNSKRQTNGHINTEQQVNGRPQPNQVARVSTSNSISCSCPKPQASTRKSTPNTTRLLQVTMCSSCYKKLGSEIYSNYVKIRVLRNKSKTTPTTTPQVQSLQKLPENNRYISKTSRVPSKVYEAKDQNRDIFFLNIRRRTDENKDSSTNQMSDKASQEGGNNGLDDGIVFNKEGKNDEEQEGIRDKDRNLIAGGYRGTKNKDENPVGIDKPGEKREAKDKDPVGNDEPGERREAKDKDPVGNDEPGERRETKDRNPVGNDEPGERRETKDKDPVENDEPGERRETKDKDPVENDEPSERRETKDEDPVENDEPGERRETKDKDPVGNDEPGERRETKDKDTVGNDEPGEKRETKDKDPVGNDEPGEKRETKDKDPFGNDKPGENSETKNKQPVGNDEPDEKKGKRDKDPVGSKEAGGKEDGKNGKDGKRSKNGKDSKPVKRGKNEKGGKENKGGHRGRGNDGGDKDSSHGSEAKPEKGRKHGKRGVGEPENDSQSTYEQGGKRKSGGSKPHNKIKSSQKHSKGGRRKSNGAKHKSKSINDNEASYSSPMLKEDIRRNKSKNNNSKESCPYICYTHSSCYPENCDTPCRPSICCPCLLSKVCCKKTPQ